MKKIGITVFFLVASTLAYAQSAPQSGPDPVFLQKAIAAAQAQRNEAQDKLMIVEAQLDWMREALAKAQARVRELEAAATPSK